MAAYALTGSATPLGRRVVEGFGGEDAVVALLPDQEPNLDGASCVVSLALGPCPSPDGAAGDGRARLAQLRRLLDAAAEAGIPRVVHLSSAVVYGAAPSNDLPLTEDAPVRPDPGFAWAVELAEAERLVADWRDGGAGRAAAVLRPALVLAPDEDDDGELARALGGLAGPRTAGTSRPVQFVHVDDVASAVVTCATAAEPVDGPLNVAPQGWLGDDEAAALGGGVVPPPAVPAGLVRPVRRLCRLLGVGATPADTEAYVTHPWVVAADRLRALGWVPSHTVEEAVVTTSRCSPLADLSPRRRQELLLGATAALLAGLVVGLALAVGRVLRR